MTTPSDILYPHHQALTINAFKTCPKFIGNRVTFLESFVSSQVHGMFYKFKRHFEHIRGLHSGNPKSGLLVTLFESDRATLVQQCWIVCWIFWCYAWWKFVYCVFAAGHRRRTRAYGRVAATPTILLLKILFQTWKTSINPWFCKEKFTKIY